MEYYEDNKLELKSDHESIIEDILTTINCKTLSAQKQIATMFDYVTKNINLAAKKGLSTTTIISGLIYFYFTDIENKLERDLQYIRNNLPVKYPSYSGIIKELKSK